MHDDGIDGAARACGPAGEMVSFAPDTGGLT
jgi:hypothetical protein